MNVCFVLTAPFALNAFVAPAIRALLARGDSVTVVVNARAGAVAEDMRESIEIVDLEIARAIAPLRDLAALRALSGLFRTRRFDIVHSVTPKAGLLAMMAARLAGVTIRIHTFTGQVWATRKGPVRWLLRRLDRVLANCASVLLVDSRSQKDFLESEEIGRPGQLHVLGKGSIAGVDTERFSPMPQWRREIRSILQIPADAVLILYVGRMHAEKGVVELAQSFEQISFRFPNLHLLLVGPDEGALKPALEKIEVHRARVHCVGLTDEPEKYMAASDLFCLASYREGFGVSVIEAAAAGLPCVASKIYGLIDAVVENVTGFLVPVRDVHALAQALAVLVEQPTVRQSMGEAARQRAVKDFSQSVLVQAWLDFYKQQLASAAVQR